MSRTISLVGPKADETRRSELGSDTANKLKMISIWGASVLSPARDPSIVPALTAKQLKTLGRLRYQLYVERDGKAYPRADRASQTLLEPVDDWSLNLQAVDHQRCLAAVRLTRGRDCIGDPQLSAILLNCQDARPPFTDCLVLSRLIVRPEMRARFRLPNLLRRTYEIGLVSGGRYAFLATRPEFISLFERFGFIASSRRLQDSVAGALEILVLDMLDRERLVEARSPLLPIFDATYQQAINSQRSGLL